MHYLDRNEFQFDLPPKCSEFLNNIDAKLMTHYTRDYSRNIKSVISERIANDFDIPEHNVLLGYGAEDLLKQTIHYFLKEKSNLLVPENSWWYYQNIAEEVGGITVQFPVHKTEKKFDIRVEELIELYHEYQPKVILIATPNNPTGNSIPIDALEKILVKCPNAFIAIDEAYWGYTKLDNSYVKRFIENYTNVIILRTFSKYYGLPGVRIGFAFINEKNDQFISFANRYLGYNRLSEQLALAALDSPEHYERISEIMREDKNRYYAETRTIPGVKVYETDANFILAEIPENAVNRLKELLAEQNISIKFLSEKGLENHLRISIAPLEVGDKVREAIKQAVLNS